VFAAVGGLRTGPNRDTIGHSPYTNHRTYRHTSAYGDSHPDVHADAHLDAHPNPNPDAVAWIELDRFRNNA